jgi:hypothetical protein
VAYTKSSLQILIIFLSIFSVIFDCHFIETSSILSRPALDPRHVASGSGSNRNRCVNRCSSIVAYVFLAAGTCLPRRYLARNVSSVSLSRFLGVMSQYITLRKDEYEHDKAVRLIVIIQGDSKLLLASPFTGQRNPDNNLVITLYSGL